MKKLICVHEVEGFTIGRSYDLSKDGANIMVINDLGECCTFGTVEGEDDFKNFFVGMLNSKSAV